MCYWIRYLSPIRMYLYGNEQKIANDWSQLMIRSEIDHSSNFIVNDDDWHTFLENEPINDNIKWNFHVKYGTGWKVTQLAPLKLDSLHDNIRFRSSLRRADVTYSSRMTTVTAKIFDWYDSCLELGFLQSEVNPLFLSGL